MEQFCGWLKPKENVIIFDNGLRIESEWQSRYVVCQRRCSSEAPLIGIFKSGTARDRGNHLELFYLQNYIGYEYGFKFKRTKRTLAILVQGQALIFSFHYLDSMLFWKEWLKDVCGRSAIYFMRAYVIPRDPAIVKLTSRDVRVHITRFALVIVQNIPPIQSLYLRLDDLFDVQCIQNKFIFRALAHTWPHPHEFLFVGDQVGDLNVKLQCLLKPRQFLNPKILKSELLSPSGIFGNVSVGVETMPQMFLNQQQQQQRTTPTGKVARNMITQSNSGTVSLLLPSQKASTEKSQSIIGIGQKTPDKKEPRDRQHAPLQQQQLQHQHERNFSHLKQRRRKSSGTLPSLLPPQTPVSTTSSFLPPPLSPAPLSKATPAVSASAVALTGTTTTTTTTTKITSATPVTTTESLATATTPTMTVGTTAVTTTTTSTITTTIATAMPSSAALTPLFPHSPALYLNLGYYENWTTINAITSAELISAAHHRMRKVYSLGDLKNLVATRNGFHSLRTKNRSCLPYNKLQAETEHLNLSTSENGVLAELQSNSTGSTERNSLKNGRKFGTFKPRCIASALAIYNNEKRNNSGSICSGGSSSTNKTTSRTTSTTKSAARLKCIKSTQSKSASEANVKNCTDWLQRRPSAGSILRIVEALQRPVGTNALAHPVLKGDNSANSLIVAKQQHNILPNGGIAEFHYENCDISPFIPLSLDFQSQNAAIMGKNFGLNNGNISGKNSLLSPRTKRYSRNDIETTGDETEEGAYAIPELIGIGAQKFSVASAISPTLAYFGMAPNPFQFMNQNTLIEAQADNNSDGHSAFIGAPPPGFIKPQIPAAGSAALLTNPKSFGKLFCKNLRKNISGSFLKYDGDHTTHEYPLVVSDNEADEDEEFRALSFKRRNTMPAHTVHNNSSNKFDNHKSRSPMEHQFARNQLQNLTFDSSTNSSVRLENAVRKGRERMRQQQATEISGRRQPIEMLSRDSSISANYSSSHQEYDVVDNEVDDEQTDQINDVKESKSELDNATTTSLSNGRAHLSVSTLAAATAATAIMPITTHCLKSESITSLVDHDTIGNNTIGSNCVGGDPALDTTFTTSNNETLPEIFLNSCISLPVGGDLALEQNYYNYGGENIYEDISAMMSLANSLNSVCSELNPRVVFQRGGRGRASGHSIKSAHKKQQYREKQQQQQQQQQEPAHEQAQPLSAELNNNYANNSKECLDNDSIAEKQPTATKQLQTEQLCEQMEKVEVLARNPTPPPVFINDEESNIAPPLPLKSHQQQPQQHKSQYQPPKSAELPTTTTNETNNSMSRSRTPKRKFKQRSASIDRHSSQLRTSSKQDLSKLHRKYTLVQPNPIFDGLLDDYADIVEDPRHYHHLQHQQHEQQQSYPHESNVIPMPESAEIYSTPLTAPIIPHNSQSPSLKHPNVPEPMVEEYNNNGQQQQLPAHEPIDYVSICPSSTMALGKLSRNRKRFSTFVKKSNSMNALNHHPELYYKDQHSPLQPLLSAIDHRQNHTVVDDPFINNLSNSNENDTTETTVNHKKNKMLSKPAMSFDADNGTDFLFDNDSSVPSTKLDQQKTVNNQNFHANFPPLSNRLYNKRSKMKKKKASSSLFLFRN